MDTNDLMKRMDTAERDIVELKNQMRRLSDGIATSVIQTAEMYNVFVSLKGGFQVIGWIGKAVKPLLYISAFLAAGYGFLKTGVWVVR